MADTTPILDPDVLARQAAFELRRAGVQVDEDDVATFGPAYAEEGVKDLADRSGYARSPHGPHLAPALAKAAVREYVKLRLQSAPTDSPAYLAAVGSFHRRAAVAVHVTNADSPLVP